MPKIIAWMFIIVSVPALSLLLWIIYFVPKPTGGDGTFNFDNLNQVGIIFLSVILITGVVGLLWRRVKKADN